MNPLTTHETLRSRCSDPFDTEQIHLAPFLQNEVGGETQFAKHMRKHVAAWVGEVERLPAPRCSFQKGKQFCQRTESFLRKRLDLVFSDRVQAKLVHLPTTFTLGEDFAPRPCLRRRLTGEDLVGSNVHLPTAFWIPCRITG
jgi:hypothetical protein